MIINIHAGHNPDGKTACGAVGLIKESTEARKVAAEVISQLRALGHTVYDCTVDNGTSQNDVLKKIVAKCNAHKVDLDISIHFNSGANDKSGNGVTTGTEVWLYSTSSKAKDEAQKVVNAIAALGFKNRGLKYSTGLYFLKNTASPSMLIEVAFVDDKDDVAKYNYKTVASAIVKGITGKTVSASTSSTTSTSSSATYMNAGVNYAPVFDPTYYANKYSDLKAAFGSNTTSLFNHFIANGMKEGRQASANFNVNTYKANYADLRTAFGSNLPSYYRHYCTNGVTEGRKAI